MNTSGLTWRFHGPVWHYSISPSKLDTSLCSPIVIISCLAAGIFSQSLSGIQNRVLKGKARGGFYSNIYSSLSFLLLQELVSFMGVCIIDFIDYSMILYQNLCFLSRIFDQFTPLCAWILQLCVCTGTGILGWRYPEPLGCVEMLLCHLYTSNPPGLLQPESVCVSKGFIFTTTFVTGGSNLGI